MTLRVNSEFATLLGSSASKVAWSTNFKNGLGATRRVVCKSAPAGTVQDNVYSVGTKFRDAAITGTLVIEGGVVTNYGVTSNLTTALAANLLTSTAVLRIEGGGHWVEGSLGLTREAQIAAGVASADVIEYDFALPANPTATNSIAVMPNLRIKPPPFLWSGNGFTPPELDADAPAYMRFMDCQNEAAPVEIGRLYPNKRLENWTFTDTHISDAMGDIRDSESTQKIVYGNNKLGFFEFSAKFLTQNAAANATANKPRHQVLINCKPTESNWPNYPTENGYQKGTRTLGTVAPIIAREYGISTTFFPALKIEACRADGSVLPGTIQMRDGLPVNSSQLTDYPTMTKALRPKVNCAQMLLWESHDAKLNPNVAKLFSGIYPSGMRQTQNKYKAAVFGSWDLYKHDQANGLEHWWGADKWAMPCNAASLSAKPSQDPYLYNMASNGENAPWSTPQWAVDWMGLPVSEKGTLSYGISAIEGIGYEPGSKGIHNWNTGPGSVRIDRGFMPGPTMYHLSDPAFVHLRSQTPIAEAAKHWNMNYLNHSYHYFRDVVGFKTLPMDELLTGKWGTNRTFYGPSATWTSGSGGLDYSVPQFAQRNSISNHDDEPHLGYFTDVNYSMPWNGYVIDGLHNYTTPFYAAALYSSPAHAYLFKHRYIANLIQLGGGLPTGDMQYDFGVRSFAWMLMHEVHAWKLASDHPNGIRRDIPFGRLVDYFNSVNRDFYVPIYVNDDQTPRLQLMKRLGLYVRYKSGGWYCESWALQYYISGVLAQMRSFGLWDILWNHSTSVRQGMTMLIRMLDTGAVAYFLQTSGRYSGSTYNGAPYFFTDNANASATGMVTDYADWLNRVVAPADKTAIDFVTRADGTERGPDISDQLRIQYVLMRKQYLGDIPCAYDLNAAVTMVQGWVDKKANAMAVLASNGTSMTGQANADWGMLPNYAPLKPPVTPLF